MTESPRRADRLVAIVEDHQLFGEALAITLEAEGYRVRRVDAPDDASAPTTLVRKILTGGPLVVLLDLDLGGFGDGVRLIEPLAAAGTHVVVVTGSLDRARWGRALLAGAATVLSKRGPLHDIIATVQRLHLGLPVLRREEREALVVEWTRHVDELHRLRERLDLLSVRESQILGHLMKGRAVREIAGLSTVSEATVRTQVKAILAKLEVNSQLAAVGLAHEIGWQGPVG